MDGVIPVRETCKKSRENGGGRGGSNHASSYFLNDGDQSRGGGQREAGQMEILENRGRRVLGSPDHLILSAHLSEVGGAH